MNGTQAIRMPSEGENILEFADYHKGFVALFMPIWKQLLKRPRPASLMVADRIHLLIKSILTVDILTKSSAVITINLLSQSSPIEALGQSVIF